MRLKSVLGLICVLSLLVVGVWLLAAGANVGPDSVAHQDAVQRALGLGRTGEAGSDGWQSPGPRVFHSEPVTAVVANLDKLPSGVGAGNSQYERWLRGEIDLDEHESFYTEAELAALRAETLALPPNPNIQELESGPGLTAPVVLTNFESIDITDCCVSGSLVPPDPEMAAGLNHVIAVVNVSFQIYDKSGTPSNPEPTRFANFFSGVPVCVTFPFDPNVLYDEEADRFMLGVDGNGDYYCVAVSDDGDPNGTWYQYAFDVDEAADDFFDYPHAGVGDEAIYMGANIFGDAGGFRESRVYAFEKAQMYNGDPADMVSWSIPVNQFTPQPLRLHGYNQASWPSGPHYVIAEYNGGGGTHALYSWSDPFGANTFQLETLLDLNAFIGNPAGAVLPAPQMGSAALIAGNDNRTLDFEYRNGSGWLAQPIGCNPGGGSVDCVRWAQIDLATGNIIQAGDFASDGEYMIFPDIAVNHCGDAAIGFTKTSTALHPGVWFTGRQADDPPNTMQAEAVLKDGEAVYFAYDGSPLRWGDYTGMTIDPDGRTFWYLGEYAKDLAGPPANWGNYIGALRYEECSVEPDFALTADPTTAEACIGADVPYDIFVASLAGFSDPVTLSTPVLPAGISSSFSVNPVNPPGTSVMTLDTTGGSAGSYDIDVVGTALTQVHTVTVGLDLAAGGPTAPTLISPADGAVNQSVKPLLTWSGDAASYEVEIAEDIDFTNIVESAVVDETSYRLQAELDLNTTYYWRVRGSNACGVGDYSEVFSFTTVGDGSCPVGSLPSVTYLEEFEAGAPGWTHIAPTGPDTWTLTNVNPSPGSGGFAYQADDHTAPSDQRLTSPAISLPAGAGQLTLQFYNEQNFEDPAGSGGCWDGGLIEISTDSGTTWTQLDAELLNDPYDGVGDNGPPAGRWLWCGETAGQQPWLNSLVDLETYKGEEAQFRLSLLTDAAVGAEGWYIDDFQVVSCVPEAQFPAIEVSKTVSDDGSCGAANTLEVAPGTEVTYCYTMANTGAVSVTSHLVEDDQLGVIGGGPFDLTVEPGGSAVLTATAVVSASVTNVVTWTAETEAELSDTATASATVTVVEPPETPSGIYLPAIIFDQGAAAGRGAAEGQQASLWLLPGLVVVGLAPFWRRRPRR
ncbi:MAG: DUF7507 domain-containing protein [Candidatus Promineifilaceae bacterium]